MYIRKTGRRYKDKTYVNFLLVESVLTEKGPRQKVERDRLLAEFETIDGFEEVIRQPSPRNPSQNWCFAKWSPPALK
jgi:hypothetical protein